MLVPYPSNEAMVLRERNGTTVAYDSGDVTVMSDGMELSATFDAYDVYRALREWRAERDPPTSTYGDVQLEEFSLSRSALNLTDGQYGVDMQRRDAEAIYQNLRPIVSHDFYSEE